jgi:hypothetical protein
MIDTKPLKLVSFVLIILVFCFTKVNAQFSTPTIDATNDGAAVYPNNYVSGSTTWYLTWDNTDLSVFLQNANQTEPITIYLDVDPIVPVNGGTGANGTLIGLNYDSYAPAPNLPFRADVCIYAHNGYRELFRRDNANGWTSLGGGNDGICGGGNDDYTGNANGQYAANDNGNGSGGDDRREFKISWARLQGAINGGVRPAAFNWMGYVAYNNGMYAQVPVENYNGGSVSSNSNGLVRYFTVLNTGNGTSTNPFSLNSYTQPLSVGAASFGGISVWDFTMNSNAQTITRTAGAGGVWNIAGSLVVADGTIAFGTSTNVANVGNIDIRGGTLSLSGSVGGDLNISENFQKTSGTFNCNSRQVQFNGTTAQSFSSNTAESINFLLNSNTTSTLTINSNVIIPLALNTAIFAANTNTIIASGAMLDIGTNSTTVTANNAGSLITVNGTLRNSGVINASAATLVFSSSGVYEHNWTTLIGTIPTATWSAGSTCSVIGYTTALTLAAANGYNQAFSNFTWNCTNQAATTFQLSGFLTTINGNFNMLSSGTTGVLALAVATSPTITIGGNYLQTGGNITMSTTTGNPVINLAGDFTLTGGTLSKTLNGTNVGTVTFNGTLNQNINIPTPANIINSVNFRLNNANGITIVNGSTLPITTSSAFRKSLGNVTLSGTGVMTYNPTSARLIYDGTTDITTSDAEWPIANGPSLVTLGHTVQSNITLHASRTLPSAGILTINLLNRLVLGNNNLTINNTAAAAIGGGASSATCMIVADGTGKLIRSVTTGVTYTYPIGEMTGTIEYSPVIINFSASSMARDIGFNVINATHPQMNNPDPQAHYRNRYFGVYNSAAGTYTYTATCNYLAADNVGTVTNIKLNVYNGIGWIQATQTTSAAATSVTTVAVNETTFPLTTGFEIVGRSQPQTYVWNENSGATQSWTVASNWTPARNVISFDDILQFSNGGTSTANAIPTQTIGKILMSNNTTVTLIPAVAATLSLTGGNGDDFVVPLGSSMIIGAAPAVVALSIAHAVGSGNTAIIDGTVSTGTNLTTNAFLTANSTVSINGTYNCYGVYNATSGVTNVNGNFNHYNGTITSTALNFIFNAGSTYNHNRNGGVVPTAAWNLTSTCAMNGVTNTVPTGFVQNFGNFNWNSISQSAPLIIGANALINVQGNLSFLSTNNQVLSISSTASTLNVGGNVLIDVGSGTIRANSANVAFNLNISGNLSLSSGTYSRFAGAAVVATNFVNANSTQTFTQTAGVCSGIMNWNVGNTSTTNTLQLLSNFNLGGAASPITVNENATLDCGTYIISNSTAAFTLSNTAPGATLITANPDGIELTGALGSIQTTGARNYAANSNYIFNGIVPQNTGLGFTVSNNLTINNNANVSLSASANISGTTSFVNGKLLLNNSDITFSNASGTPFSGISASRYIVTNGTGQVFRNIATVGLPVNYTFPVGDALNYAPVQLNFSSNIIVRNIGVIVTAGAVPFSSPSPDYINRSWTFSNSAAGTYSYNPTFTYAAGDVVGTATNMKISRYVGPLWNEYNAVPNTIVTPPSMTLSANLNETSGALSSYWTGRVYASPVSYTWNGSTSNDWNTAANWTPNGIPGIIDNVLINTSAINPCVANGLFFGANNFTVNGTGNFQLAANSELTVNGNFSTSASVTYDCSSTLYISSPTAQTIPAANYGNLNIAGGDRTLINSGTIGICGTYTTGAGIITVTGSTMNYNSNLAQTITAATYNNLTISQNRGGNTITLEPGTIVVNNIFTPSVTNFTAFVDGNTFNFNGGAGQIIPAFYYFNLTSANATRTWANSGIIDIKGTFSPAATAVNTMTGSTIRFSSNLPNINLSSYTTNTANRNFNNVIFDGVGGSWNAGSVNLRTTGTLIVNNGTVNIATAVGGALIVTGTTTINGGVLNISSNVGVGTATFSSAVTVNGGQLNIANGTTAAGTGTATATSINVNGGFFVVTNGIAAGTLTQSAALTINGGTFRMTTTSGAGTVNLNSNLVQTSGSFVRAGSGVASFLIGGGFAQTRDWTQGPTFTMTGLTTFSMSGSLTTLRLQSDVNIGNATINMNSGFFINLQGFVISGGVGSIYRSYNGSRFTTSHVGGVALAPAATGCIQTATRYFGGSVIWTFNGSLPQITGTAFPGSVDGLTLSNAAGLTLSVPVRIQSTNNLTLSNGSITLGNFNLTLQIGATIGGGANSATKMIITNGTGMLVKIFSGTGSYTYPIGDNTGTAEYSPVTINFTALSSTPDSVGFRVTDAQHPNDFSATNYISRYWSCNQIASANYSYTATFRYLDADIVGVESVLKVDRWSNPLTIWTQDASSTVTIASNTLTTSSLNQTTGTLLNNDFASRSDAPFYYQTTSSGPWSTLATWEISTDPLFLSPLPVPAGVAPDATNSIGITIRNTHHVTVTSNANADQMIINSGGTLTVQTGQTFTIENGSGTDLSVNGNLNNAGTIVTNGNLEFNNAAIYYHAQNGGTIPTSTWNSGSLCSITGIINTVPAQLNQSFYDFEWNCTAQNTAIPLGGLLTTINNNFSLVNTGSPANDLRVFDNNNTGTLNIGGNLNISGGQLAIINSSTNAAGIATVNVNGNLSLSGGGIDMTGASANTAAGSNLNVKGDVTVSGSATISRSQNVPSVFTLSKSSGIQVFTVAPNSINLSNILWQVGDGLTTNMVNFNSNINIHNTATFRVMSNATLNCANFILNGGNFDNQIASTLQIGSVDGITNAPAAFGNIQTTNRTYISTANYTYNGTTAQTTGNGLPFVLTGILNIANTGVFGNNTVTLSTSGSTGNSLILTSGLFAVGTAQQFNISNTGTVNAIAGDFSTGTSAGTLNFNGVGTMSGNCNPYNVFISGAVNFGIGTVTIQNGGTLRINSGGSIAGNAAFYGTNSNLQYNVNANFNRGLEWSAASGRGFPHHVQISNNTILNTAGAAAINAAVALNTGGNLTVDAGSTLSMNFSGNNMTVPLNVLGNITFAGNLTASNAVGGDITLQGNWINNGVTVVNFNPNNRIVTFNGSSLQSITGTNTTINPFAHLTINNNSGVTLTSLNAEVQNTLNLQNGLFDLNNKQITLGTPGNNGTLTGGSATSYLISGSTTAKFVRYTSTNATTYAFPMGDAANYTPVSVQFFSSPMAANTQVSVNVIDAAHPNLGTSTNYLTRYWTVEPNNLPNALTDYGVTYEYATSDVVGVEANIKPYKHSTVGWIAALGSGASFEMGTGSVNPGTNTITWTGLNNFSDFTGNGNGSPLPVSLIEFNAQPVLNQVELTWTTHTETNNDYFTVEKSTNGNDFNMVAQVPGAGNSNQILNYKLIDEQPYQGVSYYRLKQTDFDGKFSYSEMRTVYIGANTVQNNLNVYPNPTNVKGVYVIIPETFNGDNTTIQLTDIYGKIIFSKELSLKSSESTIFIDFEEVANGIYTLNAIQQNGNVKALKLSIIE